LPFFRRLPFKRGFTNIHRKRWSEVNIGRLDLFDEGSEVTPVLLHAAGLIREEGYPVVVLGHGKLKKALTVQAHRVTSGARAAIEKAGGSVKLLDQ
jgi:large subunit ribosomal protein L15